MDSRRRRLLTSAIAAPISLGGILAVRQADAQTIAQVPRMAEELWAAQATWPYAAEGNGAPIYVQMSQSCVFCKAMARDVRRRVSGFQIRWTILNTDTDDNNQAAEFLRRPTLEAFDTFMAQRLRSPNMNASETAISAYSSHMASQVGIMRLFEQSGIRWATPLTIWKERGGVFTVTGYTPELYQALARRWRSQAVA